MCSRHAGKGGVADIFGEALDPVVRGMHFQDGVDVADDGFEVREARSVGCSNLDEARPAHLHQARQPERSPDLDEFTARHRHRATIAGNGRQRQQKGGCVVVHGQPSLGTGDRYEQLIEVRGA